MESNSTAIEGRASAPCSASSESPWKPIGELGEIAYMEDGAHRWKLWAGYEEMRLFLVYLACGDIETHYASIDDGGMLCNEHGDDVGWAWYDAEYFMDIPPRPSLPNVQEMAGEALPSSPCSLIGFRCGRSAQLRSAR